MNAVELRNVAKRYGRKTVLRDVSFTVAPGDFTVIFGQPVSGKSVLVRLLTGLETADAGQVLLRGVDVTRAAAGARNIGYVPQSFALYPHFTVRANISYPLDLAKTPKGQIEPEVQRVAGLLGIQDLLDRKPDQLSGGQKQRVAIARGLIKQTDIYVLDDPLVGLDFKLRERLIEDLRRTQQLLGVTFIYTTSDAVESMMLASQIGVLHAGEIVEVGAPVQIYDEPQRMETMRYVGFPQANFLAGTLTARGDGALLETPILRTPVAGGLGNGEVAVGIRPEHVRLGDNLGVEYLTTTARVFLREDLGGEEIIYLDAAGAPLATVIRSDDQDRQRVEIDQTVTIGVRPQDMIIFADGRRVGRGG